MLEVQDLMPNVPLDIERVGFRGVRRRVSLYTPRGPLILDVYLSLYVDVPVDRRGVHLSRSVEVLYEVLSIEGSSRSLEEYLEGIAVKLLDRHSYASRVWASAKTVYYVDVDFEGLTGVEPVGVDVEVMLERGGGRRWVMFIDVTKCYGCMACVVACAAENNVPIGVLRTWVERHVLPGGSVVFVPKQCNHCDNPPCVKPCPTGATYRSRDGLILVDPGKCIGCGACIVACPYGARYFNPLTGVADKCTFCDHRIYLGRLPACVEACPTRARVFGDLSDPHSEVRKLVDRLQSKVLKPETGAEPQIYYYALPEVASR